MIIIELIAVPQGCLDAAILIGVTVDLQFLSQYISLTGDTTFIAYARNEIEAEQLTQSIFNYQYAGVLKAELDVPVTFNDFTIKDRQLEAARNPSLN